MEAKMAVNQIGNETESSWTKPEPALDHPWVLDQLQERGSLWADPQAVKSLNEVMESLISSYLAANLNFKGIPLKEFMDSCEKQILLSCLRLTRGHQRNAAAILGLKSTALFEKMRKHCINGRQLKLAPKLHGTESLASE
jgi:DNA-binding NtrC family response regulator